MRSSTYQRTVVVALVAALAIAALGVVSTSVVANGSAYPAEPAAYYGEVTIDGEPAPDGVTIEAVIDGEVRGSVDVDEPGQYGGDGAPDVQWLIVDGDEADAGATVEFHATGAGYDRMVAEETVAWESGATERVDLTFTGDDGDEVAEPTVPDEDADAGPLVLAELSVEPDSVTVGEEVAVSASSTISEEPIADYDWSIDGEAHDAGEAWTTSFDAAGTYEIELVVTDEVGTTDTATATVTVEAEGGSDDGDDGTEADDADDDADGLGGGFVVVGAVLALIAVAVAVAHRRASA